MQDFYHKILDQKCRLEQVLKNIICLAYDQLNAFAYNLMKGLGYIATMSGEVAHIIKRIHESYTPH